MNPYEKMAEEVIIKLLFDDGGLDVRVQNTQIIAQSLHTAALMGAEKEICICAAVIAEDGTIIRGYRHGNCIQHIVEMGKRPRAEVDSQGFITSRNRYVNREDGRKLQDAAGIPSADPEGYRGRTLFSEDLY